MESNELEIEMPEKKSKVAIVGTAGTYKDAPYKDEDFEIWGVNNGFMLMPRYTRWFEIHPIVFQDGHFYRRGKREFRGADMDTYMQKLAELNVPVYMQQHWEQVPKSIPYPLGDVAIRYGSVMGWFNAPLPQGSAQIAHDLYITNTISYMMALALLEDFEEIHVYGVDMAVDTEYHHQRPSCEFFMGLAAGMGKKVFLPAECDLMKVRTLYGFGEVMHDQMEMKKQKQLTDLRRRMAETEQQEQIARDKKNQFIGALNGIEQYDKLWKGLNSA